MLAPSEKNTISTIQKMIENSVSIMDFDRRIYVRAFGEKAVSTVEKNAELMPETNDPDTALQSMLNIAYDQGFKDACMMIVRVLERSGERQ
jgi:hypothetical protein